MSLHPSPAIVLVDAEPAVLSILERMVCAVAPDYDLLPVRDGTTALAVAARRPVALVATNDQQLRMDCVKRSAALRAIAPLCPIVLISGYRVLHQRRTDASLGQTSLCPSPSCSANARRWSRWRSGSKRRRAGGVADRRCSGQAQCLFL
jgi:hypothetical protein